jgi:MoaA/NifB/PqqE/SkfB family radical SAM enzyme
MSATPFDFVVDDHFRPLPDRAAAMRLFRRSVTMVEVETFSYCNRVCWFCPNAVVDRRSTTHYMDERVYLALLAQLSEADYRGTISFSRYNEPLADRVILRRLAEARAHLPHATLHTNTNGDYLTPAYLDALAESGLDSLNIQVYLGNADRYDHERMRSRLAQIAGRLRLNTTTTIDEPDVWLEAAVSHPRIRIRIYARNFERNGNSRGGSVPIQITPLRTSPCLSPFHHVYIDHTGHVMPCCNLRSDISAHADAVAGNVHDAPDIFTIYAGEAMAAWRRGLVGFEAKRGHCSGCTFSTHVPTAASVAVHERLVSDAARVESSMRTADGPGLRRPQSSGGRLAP